MDNWKLAAVVGAMTLGGVALGAFLFGGRSAEAQVPAARPLRECVVARQDALATNDEGQIEILRPSRIVRVPAGGWRPIGGGGLDAHGQGSVVFCR